MFLPDTISESLRVDLVGGLHALADPLDAQELDGNFISTRAVASGG